MIPLIANNFLLLIPHLARWMGKNFELLSKFDIQSTRQTR